MSKYANKRMHVRTAGGQFRKTRPEDVGIGGVCPTCHHLLLRHYYGDPRSTCPDPRLFKYRCWTCEPESEAEKTLAAFLADPNPPSMKAFFQKAANELPTEPDPEDEPGYNDLSFYDLA